MVGVPISSRFALEASQGAHGSRRLTLGMRLEPPLNAFAGLLPVLIVIFTLPLISTTRCPYSRSVLRPEELLCAEYAWISGA